MWVTDPLTYAEDERLDTKARVLLIVLTPAGPDGDGLVRGGVWLRAGHRPEQERRLPRNH